ncbi:MAG: D-alanyl-D-alanine carboxypeptidase/D-alanyl-D-alanine-endopeptidase, partial [Thermodesulfobacteriota bacterium]
LALLLGLLLGLAAAASAAPQIDAGRLAARHGFASDDVGFLLFDPVDGRVLDDHNADDFFIPASTTKVATALAALEILGADFRFATTLRATGRIADGTLAGDLWLRGGGDPTLTSDDLRELVAALRAAGVRRVAGAFFYDESLFPRANEIDLLQPEASTYNPAVDALAVNYNRLVLRWKRQPRTGRLTASFLSPADGGAVPVRSLSAGVLDGGLDPRIELVFAPGARPRWLLSPRLPATGSVEVPVKAEPGGLAAEVLATLAAQAGVELPEPRRGTLPPGTREIARVESEPLVAVVEGLLRFSNNLTAELTGLAAAHRLTGEGLGLRASAERVAGWWRDRLPHTSFDGFVAANHSGLSSVTRHSPRQLAAVLRHGFTAHAAAPPLPELLRAYAPGGEAEVGAQARAGDREASVRAKSGTLLYADGLVGFLTTTRGRELGFVILLTDRAARARLDARRDVRIRASPPEATDWTARAKALERELVARWSADDGK